MNKLFVLLLILSGAVNAFAQNMEASFLELRGRVEIRDSPSSGWRRAALGGSIGNRAVISTGPGSSAVIALGSSRLELRPLTMLTVEELAARGSSESAALYLRTGRVRARVTPPTGQSVDFTVGSPAITASVRGTSFEFDGRQLKVETGLVLLEGGGGQRVYVAEAQRTYRDENNQNRIMTPFEAEEVLLHPVIPELNNTGSVTRPPVIGGGTGTGIIIAWP
ncbi:MAG: FecR family protein [Spirochaetaceae bacterium]|jgi:hypothetical protein|nr:FecR family protein [Spirochaetaceae bacterium]